MPTVAEEERQAALTGVSGSFPTQTADPVEGEGDSGRTPIEIPDVGLDDAREALKGRVADESAAVQEKGEDFRANQPAYERPSDEALDVIEDPSKYRKPEDQVSWQMGQLLDEDSAYMQASARRAEEQAQRYGLLGSSMAVGASQRAAIESALPIAQQDAETSAKFGLQQQSAENQIGSIEAETELGSALMMQRMALESQQQSLDHAFKMASQGLDMESQTIIADIQGRWQMVTNDASLRLEAALKEKMHDQQVDAETVASIRGASSDLVQNYQISVEQLLKDPDFLQLGSATIQNTLNNMLSTTVAGIQFLADSSGVNLDDFLDDFETNAKFTATVK